VLWYSNRLVQYKTTHYFQVVHQCTFGIGEITRTSRKTEQIFQWNVGRYDHSHSIIVQGIYERYKASHLCLHIQGQLGHISDEDGVKELGDLQEIAASQRLME